ncbi:hypothetical protein ACFWU3_36030, partial [Streptomyces sp. NPDC058685]
PPNRGRAAVCCVRKILRRVVGVRASTFGIIARRLGCGRSTFVVEPDGSLHARYVFRFGATFPSMDTITQQFAALDGLLSSTQHSRSAH